VQYIRIDLTENMCFSLCSYICFQEIIDTVKMDIQNCYTSIGTIMGSPLSAVLAVLCYCISEYKWNASLKLSANFHHISLVDVLMMVVHN